MNEVAVPEAVKVKEVAYVWKTGKTFFLSKKEKIVADTFLKSRSYTECSRALLKEGFKKDYKTCKRWLERSHLKEYLAEKVEESGVYAGWTKERWYKVMTDHLQGKVRLANGDLYGMKLIAEYKGWGTPEVFNFNQEIRVTQMNGRD